MAEDFKVSSLLEVEQELVVEEASPRGESLVMNLNSRSSGSNNRQLIVIMGLSVLAVALGVAGGYLTRGTTVASGPVEGTTSEGQAVLAVVPDDVAAIKKGDVFGSSDETAFKDSAQGVLQAGGIGDEGSHTLVRPGGVSQSVYLTSSVTDLDKFVGMEIKVWGETFKGQAAGWLMDVGRVEVIKPEAQVAEE